MRCERILDLRKKAPMQGTQQEREPSGSDDKSEQGITSNPPVKTESSVKRLKSDEFDEFENAFDDDLDLNDPSLQGL